MRHLKLAAAFGLIGFVFTSRPWLQWLNKLSPEMGFIVKSVIIFVLAIILQGLDVIVKIDHRQTLGIILVYTAFMIIFNYQSKWIEDAESPNVELQTADGIVYHRSRKLLNLDPETARLFTFVLVPFIMVIIGSAFIRKGQNVNLY